MKKLILILVLLFTNITKPNESPLFLFSIPKCGTNLLMKCIKLLTKKRFVRITEKQILDNALPKLEANQYYFDHAIYTKQINSILKNKKAKIIFIYRDPRDSIISGAYYKLQHAGIAKKKYDPNIKVDKQKFNQQIDDSIIISTINYNKSINWASEKNVCAIKFENLVGAKGNGSQQLQEMEIKKICNFLNINPTKESFDRCINNLFGSSFTFRNGKIGDWKNYFSNEQKKLFKKIGGNLLIKLGYEKNLNW